MPLPAGLHEQPLMLGVYLHGFASSPTSNKARFFAERFAKAGVALLRPDFNEPDFSTLTLTRMLEQLDQLVSLQRPASLVIVGSSLGGCLAWHAASRWGLRAAGPRVSHLVLLAPALEFGRNRVRQLGEEGLDSWRRSGWHTFFHYGFGEPRRVHYELFEDAQRYDAWRAPVEVPTAIFQGRRDDTVDAAMVERFAAAHPNIHLRLLDDDHQLLASRERIWRETAAFIGAPFA